MTSLQKRTATLDLSQPCARCKQPVGGPAPQAAGPQGGCVPPLYLFPTGNAFHGVCAAAEVMALAIPAQGAKIEDLLGQLSQVGLFALHRLDVLESYAGRAELPLSGTLQPRWMFHVEPCSDLCRSGSQPKTLFPHTCVQSQGGCTAC